MKFQIGDHRGSIQNQVTSKAKGAHWSQPGHRLADMKLTVLEQPKYNDWNYREERETFSSTSLIPSTMALTRRSEEDGEALVFFHFVI